MKTPWSFNDNEAPADLQSTDSEPGSRRWLVFGLLCWGLVIGGSLALYTAGTLGPATPQSAQTQMPTTGVTVTDQQAKLILPLGGYRFGAIIQFKPTVRATVIVADRRIPIGQPT